MIKIENTEVVGWEAAIRGMRNPLRSHSKSDSGMCYKDDQCNVDMCPEWCDSHFQIGPNDLDLMTRLAQAGSTHRKYLRMIVVYADITAPLYWWKEIDQNKVGTVTNSCSTMHCIHTKEFTLDDFSMEHLSEDVIENPVKMIIDYLNCFRDLFNQNHDKDDWWQMIQLLPASYNQKRTIMLNYEVLTNIYHTRKNHKLDEWHTFCDWVESLPYSELITGERNSDEKGDEANEG